MDMVFNNKIEHPFLRATDINKLITRDHLIILNDINKTFKPNTPVEDIVNQFGFSLIKTDSDCGGYFSLDTRELAVKSNTSIDTFEFKNTIAHELSHLIQSKTNDWKLVESILLSDLFRLEQQCEAIAPMLSKILFNQEYVPCYNCIDAALFLKDWYGDLAENDLMIPNA